VAVVAINLALIVQLLLFPVLNDTGSFMVFLVAVIFSAEYGGLRPGVFATLLGSALIKYLLEPPYFSFSLPRLREGILLGIFVLVGLGVSLLHDAFRRARQRNAQEREQLLAQIDTERRWLEAIVQHLPAGLIVAEAPSGRLISGNMWIEQLLGHAFLPADSVADYTQYRLFHLDGRPYTAEEMPLARTIQHGEVVAAEDVNYLRGDGRLAKLRVSAAPIRDRAEKIVAGVATLYDITEQKRAEDMLRFLSEVSSALAASLDYATTLARVARLAVPTFADWCIVYVTGEDGHVQRLALAHHDPAKEALLHELERRNPLDPRTPSGLTVVLRNSKSILVPEISDVDLAASTSDAEQLRIWRELGPRSSIVAPLIAGERTFGALALVYADSGRRYDSRDLALADDLAHRAALAVDNARLYTSERAARAVAESALRERDRLFTMLSHDLKNPLTTISGLAQFLIQHLAAKQIADVELFARVLPNIITAARHTIAQIDELLDLARLNAGQPLELDCVPIDLVALAHSVAEPYQLSNPRHRIQVRVTEAQLIGTWDAYQLERVIANLLANAVKYSPKGGQITLTVAEEDEADRSWATLTIHDQGMGIPAADLPHIFEPFWRGSAVASHIRGTGLGLTSSRQIVEQHGGTLIATSELAAGATFTMRLPLERKPTA
jgi:PAS domain S-box-containing protein